MGAMAETLWVYINQAEDTSPNVRMYKKESFSPDLTILKFANRKKKKIWNEIYE